MKHLLKIDTIIAVSASDDGINSILELIAHLPLELVDIPLLIHLQSNINQKELQNSLLRNLKKLNQTAIEATEGQKIERGNIYFSPEGSYITVHQKCFQIKSYSEKADFENPADNFLYSVAKEFRSKAFGIVLSKKVNAGFKGLQMINLFGGLSMVSADFDSNDSNSQMFELDRVRIESPSKMGKDITYHLHLLNRKSKKTLTEQDEMDCLLTSLIKINSVGIIVLKESGHILEMNEKFCKILGYRRDDLMNKHFNALLQNKYDEVQDLDAQFVKTHS